MSRTTLLLDFASRCLVKSCVDVVETEWRVFVKSMTAPDYYIE